MAFCHPLSGCSRLLAWIYNLGTQSALHESSACSRECSHGRLCCRFCGLLWDPGRMTTPPGASSSALALAFFFPFFVCALPLSFLSECFSDVFTLARRPTRSWRSYRFGDGYEIVKVQESLSPVSTGRGKNLRCLRKILSPVSQRSVSWGCGGKSSFTHLDKGQRFVHPFWRISEKISLTTQPQPQGPKANCFFQKNFFHRTTADPQENRSAHGIKSDKNARTCKRYGL